MAWEIPGQPMFSLDSGSTAVAQFRGVSLDANGVILPASTNDEAFIGVAQVGNESTNTGEAITILGVGSITKLAFAGSTLSAGDTFSCSTSGLGQVSSTGALTRGVIVDGSSGSTGRLLTVLLSNPGNAPN